MPPVPGRSAALRANDFAAQWTEVREDALAAVDRVGRSGWLVLGEEVASFEIELAAWWGFGHAVGMANGLDALEIGLRCTGIGPGDRVLTTPLTAFATTLAVLRAGAEPVWCDVDDTGGLDLDRAAEALAADPGIRAVVPVHLFGHPLDPAGLRRLRDEHGVAVIEDCAQSVGAERDGAPTGRAGHVAATSLYPTKNLGALGDGGVLLTDDAAIAERARRLRNYGQGEQYRHEEPGLNSRLDELQAAVLRTAILPRLDGWLRRRAEVADRYVAALEGHPVLRAVRPAAGRSSNHLFPVEVREGAEPADVAARLREHGVPTGRHYPVAVPDQPAVRGRGTCAGPVDRARALADRELSLPIHPQLTDEQAEHVAHALGTLATR